MYWKWCSRRMIHSACAQSIIPKRVDQSISSKYSQSWMSDCLSETFCCISRTKDFLKYYISNILIYIYIYELFDLFFFKNWKRDVRNNDSVLAPTVFWNHAARVVHNACQWTAQGRPSCRCRCWCGPLGSRDAATEISIAMSTLAAAAHGQSPCGSWLCGN